MTPLAICVALWGAASPPEPPLADYFGFSGLEIVKIDPGAGPLSVADVDGDGRLDLIVVNNRASRIELHLQREGAAPGDERPVTRPNEIPEHWRYRRVLVPVSHRVQAVVPCDADGDGRLDLTYAGDPDEIVFLRQEPGGTFAPGRRHRVKGLSANRDGLAIADVTGDARPELLALVDGEIHAWTMRGDELGPPLRLAAGAGMVAFMVDDFTGEGCADVAGVIPADPAPLRLWCGRREGASAVLGPQLRFQMPELVELYALRVPGRSAAAIAVIERASRRLVLHDVLEAPIEDEQGAAIEVYGFGDPGGRARAVRIVDLDGDGLLDLVATDTQANALAAWRQAPGRGLEPWRSFPCFAGLDDVVAGNVDGDAHAELFVLSEKEGVVGRCDAGPEGIPFPRPLALPAGRTPVALALADDGGRAQLAVVVKDKRECAVALLAMDGTSRTIELGALGRPPDTVLALDADQDGRGDLLLFTRDKPMRMLRRGAEGFETLEDKDMGQYGLVQAAGADNTAVFDVDGDGRAELLVADLNYVRALRYRADALPGTTPGWQVVEQINAADSAARLVSLAVLGERIVAADRASGKMLLLARAGDRAGGRWSQADAIDVRGFACTSIGAGAFCGDGRANVLMVGEDGFGLLRLSGTGLALREFGSWRAEEERRRHHELAAGDVNGDGFIDIVSVDAGEQMCEILTLSAGRAPLYATGFKVFESKLFSGGERSEPEPGQAIIADVTGDGAEDLVLQAHDRVLIYPQMTARDAAPPARAEAP
jgi:hypothetical protein